MGRWKTINKIFHYGRIRLAGTAVRMHLTKQQFFEFLQFEELIWILGIDLVIRSVNITDNALIDWHGGDQSQNGEHDHEGLKEERDGCYWLVWEAPRNGWFEPSLCGVATIELNHRNPNRGSTSKWNGHRLMAHANRHNQRIASKQIIHLNLYDSPNKFNTFTWKTTTNYDKTYQNQEFHCCLLLLCFNEGNTKKNRLLQKLQKCFQLCLPLTTVVRW